MANTNTPTRSTQAQAFIPAFGDDTLALGQATDRTLAKFSLVDCVPTQIKNVGQDPIYSVMPRPPIIFRTSQAIGETIIAIAKGEDIQPSYVLNEDGEVYETNPAQAVYSLHSTLSTTAPYIYASGIQFTIVGTRYMAFLVTNGTDADLHIFNLSAGGPPVVVDFAAAGILFPRGLQFLDGYLFTHDGNYIYNSNVGDPDTWLFTVNFTAAEMIGDSITGLAVHKNHLVVFGTSSIEFFYNASIEIGSPMKRQAAYATTSIGKIEKINIPDTAQIEDRLYFAALVEGVEVMAVIDSFRIKLINDNVVHKQVVSTIALSSNIPLPDSVSAINTVRLYGNAAVIWSGDGGHYVYFPDSNSWSMFSIKDGSGGNRLIRWFFTIAGKTNALFLDGAASQLNYGTMAFSVISDTGVTQVEPTPEWYSQVLDFGNYNKKLLKWVDVIGTFGKWGISMSLSLDEGRRNYWITTGETKDQNDTAFNNEIFPVRFRINQPVRRFVVKIVFTPVATAISDSPFNFEKLALEFNQYTL